MRLSVQSMIYFPLPLAYILHAGRYTNFRCPYIHSIIMIILLNLTFLVKTVNWTINLVKQLVATEETIFQHFLGYISLNIPRLSIIDGNLGWFIYRAKASQPSGCGRSARFKRHTSAQLAIATRLLNQHPTGVIMLIMPEESRVVFKLKWTIRTAFKAGLKFIVAKEKRVITKWAK